MVKRAMEIWATEKTATEKWATEIWATTIGKIGNGKKQQPALGKNGYRKFGNLTIIITYRRNISKACLRPVTYKFIFCKCIFHRRHYRVC